MNMDLQSILKMLIGARGYTYKGIGEKVGGITAQGVSTRLNSSASMSVSTLMRYLKVLECDLVIRGKKEKDDMWVITSAARRGRGE